MSHCFLRFTCTKLMYKLMLFLMTAKKINAYVFWTTLSTCNFLFLQQVEFICIHCMSWTLCWIVFVVFLINHALPCFVMWHTMFFSHAMAQHCSVDQCTTLVQTETSQHLLDGFPWNLVQMFWSPDDKSYWLWFSPELVPLAPPAHQSWHFSDFFWPNSWTNVSHSHQP